MKKRCLIGLLAIIISVIRAQQPTNTDVSDTSNEPQILDLAEQIFCPTKNVNNESFSNVSLKCGTMDIIKLYRALNHLMPNDDTYKKIDKMKKEFVKALDKTYNTENFTIDYNDTPGNIDAVFEPTVFDSIAVNTNGDPVPLYVVRLGQYLEYARDVYLNNGFNPPAIIDIDVDIKNLAALGYSSPTDFFIDNDMNIQTNNSDLVYNLLKVTTAHELFHKVQFTYPAYWYWKNQNDDWIIEGTASWAEDAVFDDVNDYINYLNNFNVPSSINIQSDPNSAVLFFKHLSEQYGTPTTGAIRGINLIRDLFLWGELSPFETISTIVESYTNPQKDIIDAYRDFSIKNYCKDIVNNNFNGINYDYEEDEDYYYSNDSIVRGYKHFSADSLLFYKGIVTFTESSNFSYENHIVGKFASNYYKFNCAEVAEAAFRFEGRMNGTNYDNDFIVTTLLLNGNNEILDVVNLELMWEPSIERTVGSISRTMVNFDNIIVIVGGADDGGIYNLTATAYNNAVITTQPIKNENNVVVDKIIEIKLREAVDASTINANSIKVSGEYTGRYNWSYTLADENKTIFINTNQNFKYGEKITTTLSKKILCSNGIPILPITFQFTTKTNLSEGTFTRRIEDIDTLGIGDALDIKAGDLNNDGFVDLIITGGSTTAILINNGSGIFNNRKIFNIGGRYAEISDVNNDGNLDLLFANGLVGGQATWFIALNDGEANFTTGISNSAHVNSFIKAADFNSDGYDDLVIGWGYAGNTNASILINNGDLTFSSKILRLAGNNYGEIYAYTEYGVVSDFDNDGDLDIICSGTYGSVVIAGIIFNKGNSEFILPNNSILSFYGSSDGYIFNGDLDNDNDIDFVICGYHPTVGGIKTVYGYNQADGSFQVTNSWTISKRGVLKDFNGDGIMDVSLLLADEYGNTTLFYCLGNYVGITNLGTYKHNLAAADFDNDGDLDVAIVGNKLEIFENDNMPVPIELNTFCAIKIQNTIKVAWQTETEVNTYGFEIERSKVDRISEAFQKIGFIKGTGNSNSPKEYYYSDKNLNAGKYRYRLKMIDADGTYEYSNVIEVEIGLPLRYELSQNYPNPFNPMTTIKYAIPEEQKVILKVYDVIGSEVATLVDLEQAAGYYEVNLDAANLASGIYYYKLQSGSFLETRKMLLLK